MGGSFKMMEKPCLPCTGPDQSHQGFYMNTQASKVSKLLNQLQLSNEAWHSEIAQSRGPTHMARKSVDVLSCNCESA